MATVETTTEKISSFTQLRAWQSAREFAVYIYKITEKFPSNEKFGLVVQLRRAAISIAADIAEGFSSNSKAEKLDFYAISLGLLTEILSDSYIASDLKFLKPEHMYQIEKQVKDLHKMLIGMIKTTEGRSA